MRKRSTRGFALPLVLMVVVVGIIAVGAIAYFQLKPKQQPQQTQPTQQTHPSESLDLAPCDINSDGDCNNADLDLLNKALGTYRGQSGYHPLADINADGAINENDKQLFLKLIEQNQTAETANWKTYTNSKAGFSIQYPPDWEFINGIPDRIGTIDFIKNKTRISIAVYDKITESLLPSSSFNSCSSKRTVEKILIGGIETRKCVATTPDGIKALILIDQFTPDGKTLFDIAFTQPKPYEQNSEMVKTFELILSTFRFD